MDKDTGRQNYRRANSYVACDAATRLDQLWSSRLERSFSQTLRGVGKRVADLVRRMFDGTPDSTVALADRLEVYAEELEPWARSVAAGMIARVSVDNLAMFRRRSRTIGRLLKSELFQAPTGAVVQDAIARQVGLITSLPREAASRVQNLAATGYVSGTRVGEIRRLRARETGPLDKVPEGLAKEILKTGEVTAARANLIARTETTRVSTEFTKARAAHVGSEFFIWRTARDADVRRMHRKLEGTKHRWDDPPVAEENGVRHLPGCFPNCRCWAEPVLPDRIV